MPVEIYFRKGCRVKVSALRQALETLLSYGGKTKATVEVSLVGETKIRKLNHRWRGIDKVTDVLSFPMEPQVPKGPAPWTLGEIVVALPVARSQAKRARRSPTSQVMRLAVHGLIHLEGLDHEKSPSERKRFEAMENKYLSHLNKKGLMRWDGSLQF
ncbi:MAG: rRNA maturation RNase YbeY [bacterium]|nr:rRNA maturation RNase YbeY [bacterium]